MACLFLGRGTPILELFGGEPGVTRNDKKNEKSDLAHTQPKQRHGEMHFSTNRRPDLKSPLLLLIDGGTASAAEVLAAALSANNRCVTAGQRTLGKDVAQAVVGLSDGSGLAMTVRAYCDPLGKYLGRGIKPDLEIAWSDKIDTSFITLLRAEGGSVGVDTQPGPSSSHPKYAMFQEYADAVRRGQPARGERVGTNSGSGFDGAVIAWLVEDCLVPPHLSHV